VLPPLAARGVQTANVAQRARTMGQVATLIYATGAILRLFKEVAEVRAAGDPSMHPIGAIVLRSSWGNGWLLGVVGAGIALIGLFLSARRLRAGTPTALTGALAMILAPGLSGHAAASQYFIPSITLDALHVASVGSWIGTLSVLVLIGIPAMARVDDGNPDAAVSALVNSFHPIALLAAPMTVLAGIGSSVLRLGSIAALTSSRYGSVLLFKVGTVLLVAALGAWNSTRSRRRLGNPQATASIRRTALIEILLAVLVLWVTTDLVATPAPTELLKP
jgi:putative copper export protein